MTDHDGGELPDDPFRSHYGWHAELLAVSGGRHPDLPGEDPVEGHQVCVPDVMHGAPRNGDQGDETCRQPQEPPPTCRPTAKD
jgi:hypothetical protein